MDCYVTFNGAAWFVKEADFFEQQKARNLSDKWWTHWRKIICVDGIEHARDKARLEWGIRGERWIDPATESDPLPLYPKPTPG